MFGLNRGIPARMLAGLMLLGIASGSVTGADKVVLTADDGRTAQMVAAMVSSRHINHPQIDDALSEKLFNRYIEVWDPQKVYFL